jgi:hypothetical protein
MRDPIAHAVPLPALALLCTWLKKALIASTRKDWSTAFSAA